MKKLLIAIIMASSLFTFYSYLSPPKIKQDSEFKFAEPKIDWSNIQHIQPQDNTQIWQPPQLDIPTLQQYSVEHPKQDAQQDTKERSSKRYYPTTNRDFANTLVNTYKKVLQEEGLDPSYAYILTAQAAFESGWGKHQAGTYNFGGVKDPNGTPKKTREYSPEKGFYPTTQSFKNYNSVEDYCKHIVRLLSNNNYQAFDKYASDNPSGFIGHVINKGYATVKGDAAKNYVDAVTQIYHQILNYG